MKQNIMTDWSHKRITGRNSRPRRWRYPEPPTDSPHRESVKHLCDSAVGGFASGVYWSSTENGANVAWYQDFGSGGQGVNNKGYEWRVRPVRTF